jgi:hypothetical protein
MRDDCGWVWELGYIRAEYFPYQLSFAVRTAAIHSFVSAPLTLLRFECYAESESRPDDDQRRCKHYFAIVGAIYGESNEILMGPH